MPTNAVYGTALYGDSQYGVLLLTASSGTYTITGGSASFLYNQVLPASAGSYSITGKDASLVTSKQITGITGSYTLNGQQASLLRARTLNGTNGSYAITGVDAGGIYNQTIFAGRGVYTLTGIDAAFDYDRIFTCETGHYTLTGGNAQLQYYIPPVFVKESKGGIGKKKSRVFNEKEQREELEAIVKREFDILDGTYQPEVTEKVKEVFIPQIKQIDLNEYAIAIAQVNALLLQAKIQAAEYESEIDDEEALLMLL